MRALAVIALKDLRLLLRQPLDAFFVFAFPVLFAVLFTQVVSGSAAGASRVGVAVVDEARTPASTDLVERLLADPGLRPKLRSRADAEADLRLGRLGAFVVLPAGFGEDSRELLLGVDPSRRGEASLVEGALLRNAGRQAAATAPARGTDAGSADERPRSAAYAVAATGGAGAARRVAPARPLRVVEWRAEPSAGVAPSPGAVTLPQGLAWGLMACAAAFGTSLVSERRRGTLVRLRTAPVPTLHVLAGKGVACFVAALAVCGLLLALAGPLFAVEPTSWAMLAAATVSAATCFVGVMVLIGVLGRSEETTFRVAWAVLLVMAMLGGAMVPSYLFPTWLDAAGELSPVKWTILAFEGALWRGLTWRELLGPCGALVGTGAVAFVLGGVLFTRQEG